MLSYLVRRRVNKIRAQQGYPPIAKLPGGVPGASSHCVIANAFSDMRGGETSIGMTGWFVGGERVRPSVWGMPLIALFDLHLMFWKIIPKNKTVTLVYKKKLSERFGERKTTFKQRREVRKAAKVEVKREAAEFKKKLQLADYELTVRHEEAHAKRAEEERREAEVQADILRMRLELARVERDQPERDPALI